MKRRVTLRKENLKENSILLQNLQICERGDI